MQRFLLFVLLFLVAGCAGTRKQGIENRTANDGKIKKIEKKLAENPNDFNSYFELSQLVALRGDTSRAIANLDSALTIQDHFSSARYLKGKLLFAQKKFKKSFEEFIFLLEQDTTTAFVKKIAGTIGMVYPIRLVLDDSYDEANPCYDPSGNRIAFQSNRYHNWDIFIMNRSGGDLQQLTKSPLNDEAPVFIGENNVYFTRQQSAEGMQRDIYTYDLNEKKEKAFIVNPADDWYLAPGKDANQQYFVSDREINSNKQSKIFKYDQTNRQLVPVVVRDVDTSSPCVHPVKDQLLFTQKQNSHYGLYQCTLDGEKTKSISDLNMNFGAPQYSPDGNKVVFFSKTGQNYDLFEFDLQSGELYRLTAHPKSDLSPKYSPDGSKIIFYSDRSGKYKIYEIDLSKPFNRAKLLDKLRFAVRENKFYE